MAESPTAAQEQSNSAANAAAAVGAGNATQKLSPQTRTPNASRPESASLLKRATTNSRPGSAVARANLHAVSGSRPNSANSTSKTKSALGTRSDDLDARLLDVRVGLEIEVDFGGLGEWYPGVVRRDREDGTFDVEYDYGDIETRVSLDRMRMPRSPRQYNDIGIDLSPKGSVTGSRTGHHNLMLGDNDSVNIDMDQDLNSVASNDLSLMSPPDGRNAQDRSGSLRGSAKLNVPILFPVGTAVEVNYRGQGNWLFGKISNVRDIASMWLYDIDYDNGDIETHVEVDFIRFKGDLSPLQAVSPLDLSTKGEFLDDGKITRNSVASTSSAVIIDASMMGMIPANAVTSYVKDVIETAVINRSRPSSAIPSAMAAPAPAPASTTTAAESAVEAVTNPAATQPSEAVTTYVQEVLETAVVNRSRPSSATPATTTAVTEANPSVVPSILHGLSSKFTMVEEIESEEEQLTVGTRITADYFSRGKYYPGRVIRIRRGPDGVVYDISYDDGEIELRVEPERIRVAEEEEDGEERGKNEENEENEEDEEKPGTEESSSQAVSAEILTTSPPSTDPRVQAFAVPRASLLALLEPPTAAATAASTEGALFQVHDRIEANYCGKGQYYPGRIRRDRGNGSYDIDYDDGASEVWVETSRIKLIDRPKPDKAEEMEEEKTPVPPRESKFKEGDRVEANYRNRGKYYPCTIRTIHAEDGTYDVDYDDGESELHVKETSLRSIDIITALATIPPDDSSSSLLPPAGEKVEVNYRGKGKFYPGHLRRDRGDGTFDIAYDDGEIEMYVEAVNIRWLERNATELSLEKPIELLVELQEQDPVEANYRGRGKYYRGRIKCIHRDDNTFDIDYDDGETETRVKAYLIFKLDRDPADAGREIRRQVALSPRESGIVKVGDQVLVQTHVRDAFREVTITAINSTDGTFNIELIYYSHHVKEDEYHIPAYRLFVLVEATEPLEIGRFVMADYRGQGKMYPGHVKAIHATLPDHYDISYDDEEEELRVPVQSIRVPKPLAVRPSSSSSSLSFAVGDRVEVRPYNSEDYLAGEIVAVQANGLCNILYDHNGSEEKNVLPDFIRSISPASSANLLVDIAPEDRVEVDDKRFRENGRRKRGRVLRVRPDQSIDIKYAEDDKELHVMPHRVVKIGPNGIKQPLTAPDPQEEEKEEVNNANLAEASLAVNDSVHVQHYRRGNFLQATIQCDHGDGTYDLTVSYRSRVLSRVRADRIHLLRSPAVGILLAVDQKVEANYVGRGQYFPGRILASRGNDLYDILYDDGEREMEVSRDNIRILSSPGWHPALVPRPRWEIGQRVNCLISEDEEEASENNGSETGKKFLPAVIVKRYPSDDSYDIIFGHEINVTKHILSDVLRPLTPSSEPPVQLLVELQAGDRVQAFYLQREQQCLPGVVERVRSWETESKEAGSDTFDIFFDNGCIETHVKPYYIVKVREDGQRQVVARKPGLTAAMFSNGDRIEWMAADKIHFSAGTVDFAYGHGQCIITLDNGEQRMVSVDELRWPTMLKDSAQESLQRRREAVQALQTTQAQQRMKLQTVLNKVAGWKETMQQQSQISQLAVDKANSLLAEIKRIREQESQ